MKILGIDPGSTLMGFGLIEEKSGALSMLAVGVLKMAEKDPTKKLLELSQKLNKLLDKHKPELVGLEKLYFSKNKKTALEVSQARGVIANTLLTRGLPILEYGPGQIKMAITGYGNADKESVAKMVNYILKLPAGKIDDNASDALAIALTAAFGYAQTKRYGEGKSN
ncbi:MAG: crossover junction endodeoxyribonuclease RuvC [bacterium]|nr:crossover junction endodeoxyribonuclease RuvC [bacterium]